MEVIWGVMGAVQEVIPAYRRGRLYPGIGQASADGEWRDKSIKDGGL